MPQPFKLQSVEEVAAFVAAALVLRKPISAMYHKHRRSLCPHVFGRTKSGDLRVLCYQYAGGSSSGLAAPGSPDNWRCIALSRLNAVKLLNESWQASALHSRPQTCIFEVLLDSEKPIE